MSKWLEDTLAAIKRIATGGAQDQEVKDAVAQMQSQVADLSTRLTSNTQGDSEANTAQNEAIEELKQTVNALVVQLAAAPPVEDTGDTDNG